MAIGDLSRTLSVSVDQEKLEIFVRKEEDVYYQEFETLSYDNKETIALLHQLYEPFLKELTNTL